MVSYLVCRIDDFEKQFVSKNGLGESDKEFLLMACTYDSKYGVYEVSCGISETVFSCVFFDGKDEELIGNLKSSNPVALGLSRDEVLSEKYDDMNSFLRAYKEALIHFRSDNFSSFVAVSDVDQGELEKGRQYWVYLDDEDENKVFWLSDDYFLYESRKDAFKMGV